MGERLYILGDEVGNHVNGTEIDDSLLEEYSELGEILTSDRCASLIDLSEHGEVRLILSSDDEQLLAGIDDSLPIGFTGYVRHGLLPDEREKLTEIEKTR